MTTWLETYIYISIWHCVSSFRMKEKKKSAGKYRHWRDKKQMSRPTTSIDRKLAKKDEEEHDNSTIDEKTNQ